MISSRPVAQGIAHGRVPVTDAQPKFNGVAGADEKHSNGRLHQEAVFPVTATDAASISAHNSGKEAF